MTTTPTPPTPATDPPARVHKPQPAHALFLDLETTDSDPYATHAAVLEVGAVLVQWGPDLREVARASMLIRPPGNAQDHTVMWAQMAPVVRELHQANGLWAEATRSEEAWDVAQADAGLARWVREQTGSDDPVPIMGSGVAHIDVPFVKRHLPQLAARTTYWMIDFGNLRRAFQLGGRGDLVDLAGDVDAKPHRGLGDAEMHVREARRYLGLIKALPGAPGSVTDSRPATYPQGESVAQRRP